MSNIKNQKGLTMIELLISIMVASMIISMLLSILTMSLKAKATLDVENKLLNESTIIAETIRFNLFELQAQRVRIEDTPSSTIIYIEHYFDIVIENNNVAPEELLVPIVHTLTYDKVTHIITYNNGGGAIPMHDTNILILEGSSIELISFDPITCDFDNGDICDDGVIKLTLIMTVSFSNGAVLIPQTFVTTIII